MPGIPIEAEVEVPVLLGAFQIQEEHANVQLWGDEEQQEDWSPSNLVEGGDESGLDDHSDDQAKGFQENARGNPG